MCWTHLCSEITLCVFISTAIMLFLLWGHIFLQGTACSPIWTLPSPSHPHRGCLNTSALSSSLLEKQSQPARPLCSTEPAHLQTKGPHFHSLSAYFVSDTALGSERTRKSLTVPSDYQTGTWKSGSSVQSGLFIMEAPLTYNIILVSGKWGMRLVQK